MKSTSYKLLFIRSVSWTAVARGCDQITRLAVGAILSRLLLPEDFGIFSMALVFTAFMGFLFTGVISSTAIQFGQLDREDLYSLHSLSVSIGILLTVACWVLSPFVSQFYDRPDFQKVFSVLGSLCFFSSLGAVPEGLLQQRLRFEKLTYAYIIATLSSAVIGLATALQFRTYWSLVVQAVAYQAILSLLCLFYSGVRFTWPINFYALRVVIPYSRSLTLFRLINYWAENLYSIVIGKYLSASDLGYYNRAYSLMQLPVGMLMGIVNPVLHPLFAPIRDNKEQVRKSYLKTIHAIAAMAFPLMAFLLVMAHEMVRFFWGPQWEKSVPVFQILCIAGAAASFISTTGSVFVAMGRSDALAKTGAINALFMGLGIALGIPWGIMGVAFGYALAYVIVVTPLTLYCLLVKLLGADWRMFFDSVRSPLAGSAIVLAVSFLMGRYSTNLPDLAALFCAGIPSGFLYLLFVRVFDSTLLLEVRSMLPNHSAGLFERIFRLGEKSGGHNERSETPSG